jgi:hypothetical protein
LSLLKLVTIAFTAAWTPRADFFVVAASRLAT